jgi:hypothetical protein
VQIEDAFLGGERSGGKVGRASENKVPFVIAVSLNNDGDWSYVTTAGPIRLRSNPGCANRCLPDSLASQRQSRAEPRAVRHDAWIWTEAAPLLTKNSTELLPEQADAGCNGGSTRVERSREVPP